MPLGKAGRLFKKSILINKEIFMISEKFALRSLEMAFGAAGLDIPIMSDFVGSPTPIFRFNNSVVDHGFFAIDLFFGPDGKVALQEANGSNGASTQCYDEGQHLRAAHMVQAAIKRGLANDSVVLLSHADSTGLLPEFHLRQVLFAAELEKAGVGPTVLLGPDESVRNNGINVVLGSISKIEPQIDVCDGHVRYQGKEVVFATNANILPALERRGVFSHGDRAVDLSFFHEGAAGVRVSMDKGLQQQLAKGTGLDVIHAEECADWQAASNAIRHWNDGGVTAVSKISNGSQGHGVEFFSPQDSPVIEKRLADARANTIRAYGPSADVTSLPIRLFEFFESTKYKIGEAEHLWDVRIEAQISPGKSVLIPNTMRICPKPFDRFAFDRDAVVSNLSGRDHGTRFVRAPFSRHASGRTEIEWAGVEISSFERGMKAVAKWCENALSVQA